MFCSPDVVYLVILYLRSESNESNSPNRRNGNNTEVITSSFKRGYSRLTLRSQW